MADVRTEPSMEEILASIKRIIADDGLAGNTRLRPRADATEQTSPEPVLELTEPAAEPVRVEPTPAPPPPAAAAAPSEAHASVLAPAPIGSPWAAPVASAPMPVHAPLAEASTLVSDDAAVASRHSLSALSSAVARAPASDNSVEGLVRELLRPMLKEWLDARLPEIVESLVAREIARITGKPL